MWTNGSFSLRLFASKNVSQNQFSQKLWLQIIHMRHFDLLKVGSVQSRRNFGERVLSIFLTKIMAAVFDFNGSGRFGRERNLYQGGWSTVQNKESGGGGGVKITPARSLLQNSVRPRTECLIGAVKLQLSITCQMCHLSVILTFRSRGGNREDIELWLWSY